MNYRYFLRIVHADGSTATADDVRLNDFELAVDEADRITRELRADGSDARCFVFDSDDVPIAAGLENLASRKSSNKRASWR